MIKYVLFLGFCCLLPIGAIAQYIDTIQVLDEEDFPVINANVFLGTMVNEVIRLDSSTIYTTNVDGQLVLKDVAYDAVVHFSSIQHRDQTLSIHTIRANKNVVVLKTSSLVYIEVIGKGTTNEKTPLSEVPGQVTVINNDQIRLYNPQTSADALAQSGDVFVQKSQMGGGSPVIRGFEANKVLLVVDGVRLNNAIYRSGHLQNVITIDNAAVERIEVHHGPGSVMYGSDALGGVMHFYTQTPRFRTKDMKPLDINAYSRFSTANYEFTNHIDFNVGSERFASFTSVTLSSFQDLRAGRVKSSNNMALAWNRYFYATRQDSIDLVAVNENPNVQVGTAYAQLDAIQKLRFRPKDGIEFLLNLQYSTSSNVLRYDQLTEGSVVIDNGQITKQVFKFSEWHYGPQQRFFAALSVKLDQSNPLFYTKANITAAFQRIDEDRITRKFDSPLRRSQMEDVYVFTLNADFIKEFGKTEEHRSRLLYGLEGTHNIVLSNITSQNILTGEVSNQGLGTRYPDGGSSMSTGGVYASYRYQFHKRAHLIGGARFALARIQASFGDTTLYRLPYDQISSINSALTGSLALAWTMGKGFQFNTSLSSAFRTPNIDDNGKIRAKGDKITIPNPDITPEQSLNFEITLGKRFGKKALLSGTFFYTHMYDAILQEPFQLNGVDSLYYDGSFRKIYSNINAGQAFIWGASLNMKLEFTEHLFLQTGINYTEGRELETGSDLRPLAHIPPTYGQIEVHYQRKVFQTRFNLRFNGPKLLEDYSDDSSENLDQALPEGTPSWFTLNIYSMVQLNRQFSLNLNIENLLDWHYRPYGSGVSAPGINVIVAIRGKF